MTFKALSAPRLAFACLLAAASPSIALAEEGEPRGERLLPNDEELRALGDLAQRWMRDFAERVDPMAERLRDLVEDLDAYQSPEMLPNGDIIIRRKPAAPKPDLSGRDRGEGLAL